MKKFNVDEPGHNHPVVGRCGLNCPGSTFQNFNVDEPGHNHPVGGRCGLNCPGSTYYS